MSSIARERDSEFPITANAYDSTIMTSYGPPPPGSTGGVNDAFLVRIFDRPVGHAVPATLLYGTFFGGDTQAGTPPGQGGEVGNRGRSLSIIELSGHPFEGHALFCGVTTVDDFPVTPPALFETWFLNDERQGFISIHDMSP